MEWVNTKEAIKLAKEMTSTVVILLLFKNGENLSFVVEVVGIEQMAFVIKELEKLKTKKKINSYNINNLTSFPAVDFEGFKKILAETL